MTPSVRRSLVRPSTLLNIFFSKPTGPIKLKFHMVTSSDSGTTICSIGPGHMTKMATMLIYGNLLQNEKADDTGTWYVTLEMFVQMMILC